MRYMRAACDAFGQGAKRWGKAPKLAGTRPALGAHSLRRTPHMRAVPWGHLVGLQQGGAAGGGGARRRPLRHFCSTPAARPLLAMHPHPARQAVAPRLLPGIKNNRRCTCCRGAVPRCRAPTAQRRRGGSSWAAARGAGQHTGTKGAAARSAAAAAQRLGTQHNRSGSQHTRDTLRLDPTGDNNNRGGHEAGAARCEGHIVTPASHAAMHCGRWQTTST
jgi:hypothetical protein